MCKSNMNSFNSKTLNFDLSNDVDNIIADMLKEDNISCCDSHNPELIVKCIACEYEDIDNMWNFKNCCVACNNKICLTCYNECVEDESITDYILNHNNDEDSWLCVDCAMCCEHCDEYSDEYSIYPLLDIEGDYQYCCRECIIEKELDMCRFENGNIIRYIKQEFIPNSSDDYVNCECGVENSDLEFIGDGDEDDDKYDNMDDEDKLETGDFERVLNENTFYNYYDEEEGIVCVCCDECGHTGLRY